MKHEHPQFFLTIISILSFSCQRGYHYHKDDSVSYKIPKRKIHYPRGEWVYCERDSVLHMLDTNLVYNTNLSIKDIPRSVLRTLAKHHYDGEMLISPLDNGQKIYFGPFCGLELYANSGDYHILRLKFAGTITCSEWWFVDENKGKVFRIHSIRRETSSFEKLQRWPSSKDCNFPLSQYKIP